METTWQVETTSVTYAALAFLAWDWVISIGDEVELIWRVRCGWQRWMYCFLRYFPLALELVLIGIYNGTQTLERISSEGCKVVVALNFLSLLVLNAGVEVVLSLRVYALYCNSTYVFYTLLGLFMGNILATSTIAGLGLHQANFGPSSGCNFAEAPHIMDNCWVAQIAYETILFIMTIIKCLAIKRESQSLGPLFCGFLKDGTWAYAILFLTLIVNALVYGVFPAGLANELSFCAVSALSFTGSHVILNLRKLAVQTNGSKDLPTTIRLSRSLRFATHVSFAAADTDPRAMDIDSFDEGESSSDEV